MMCVVGSVLRLVSVGCSTAVFMEAQGESHTCRLGFPFLRVIFMALHQLCSVSDVRTDSLSGSK